MNCVNHKVAICALVPGACLGGNEAFSKDLCAYPESQASEGCS